MDLSPAFIAGAREVFPQAEIIFDRFHVVKLLNKAMDEVRRAERKEHNALKGHKYLFLKHPDTLSNQQCKTLSDLIALYPGLGQACCLKTLFDDLWDMKTKPEAEAFLKLWRKKVEKAKPPAFDAFARTVKSHWSGILHFVESRITNGILEGINSKVQLAKRRARGYWNTSNFINMIYFLCGKLTFDCPLLFT